jgi:TRAP-type C4-dicarboxylate transport system permease small subunit
MTSSQDKKIKHHRIWRWLLLGPQIVCGILMAIISVVVFLTVIFRYFLHMPLGWTEELSRLLFLWIVFLGAAVCAGQERHTKFDMFVKNLKPATGRILDIISSVLILVITGVIIYKGFLAYRLIFFERFVILGIPYSFGFMALPFSAILIFLYYCHHLYLKIKGFGMTYDTEMGIDEGKREPH